MAAPSSVTGFVFSHELCPWCSKQVRVRHGDRRMANHLNAAYWKCLGSRRLPAEYVPVVYKKETHVVNATPDALLSTGPLDDLLARADHLADWWRETADAEIDMVVTKAVEYGATDLRDIGRMVYEMAGRAQPSDAEATEAGIAFYVIGKVSRLAAAFREGRTPSADTWLDIGVYARMAQRVKQVGAWPGV